jgi:hypothetical protein
MAIFNYTLPSGNQFRLEAPSGTTQDQADRIFYEQVAAGALVGYEAGQTLTSPASQLTKFELSRLDRGTAGVDTSTFLSIVQNLPVITAIPELVNVPVENPVDQADIVLVKGTGFGPTAVGPLTSFQVQSLQAQLANLVDQPFDVITQEKGIGKYGLNSPSLEQLGYVKPGTYDKCLKNNPENFVAVMNSPEIWTGRNGINNLNDLLNDENSQNIIQNELMQSSFDALVANGVISNLPTPSVSLSQGQIYTPAGFQSLNALNILGIGTNLSSVDLSQSSVSSNTLASGVVSNFAIAQTAIDAANRINGDIGALVNNASKFGSLATAAWANSGSIPNIGNLLTGKLNLPTLPNLNLNQITGGLTNIVPTSLGALKSGLDKLGKASQFSMNFSNPLASLQNINVQGLATGALSRVQGQLTGALTNVQGQLTGAVGNLQGQLTGALTNVQGQLTGAVGNLQGQLTGALANVQGQITGLTNLFSGGGNLVSGTRIAAGFTNTVKRKTIDSAVVRILGNSKISLPSFEFPSPAVLAERLDIRQAQNILQGLQQQGSQVLNQVSQLRGQVSQLQGQVTRVADQATSTFNRLRG